MVAKRRLALPVILAILLMAGCASAPTVHTALDATNAAVAAALFRLDDEEMAAFTAGRITAEQHQVFSQQLVVALKVGKALNASLAAWTPGTSVPADVKTLVGAVGTLANGVVQLLPDGPTKTNLMIYVQAVQAAVDAFLVALAEVPRG